MFRVVYSAASKFKYITQTLAKINDEGMIGFTHEGLVAWIMSPDKTSLAVLNAPTLSFDEYSVEEEHRFTIRTDELNKVVKRATRNDYLVFEYDADERALKTTLTDRKTGITRAFLVKVIEEAPPELREPRMESTCRFSMLAEDFKHIIQDSKVVGDLVTIDSKDDTVVVRVTGEGKEYEWVMKLNNPLLELEIDEHTVSTYSRTSLEAMTKPTGAAENVSLEYATNYPLKAVFSFPNAEKLSIYVAPVTE